MLPKQPSFLVYYSLGPQLGRVGLMCSKFSSLKPHWGSSEQYLALSLQLQDFVDAAKERQTQRMLLAESVEMAREQSRGGEAILHADFLLFK
jgi:hypothetical protein